MMAATSAFFGRRSASSFSSTGVALAKINASAMRLASEKARPRSNSPCPSANGSAGPDPCTACSSFHSFGSFILILQFSLSRLGRAAQIDVAKCLLLTDFQCSFPHHFQRCGKGARPRGCPLLRRRKVGENEPVERSPFAHATNQSRQDLARLFKRPNLALCYLDIGDRATLALCCIGNQEVVKRRMKGALFGDHDRLRHATRENFASQPVTVDQSGRSIAHRFKALQAELQERRHFLTGRLAVIMRF